ncbi:hypothetical protein BDB00DRAFT_871366 [Zychaea mexicana]|uniref:uncharacterized protein n=1 Tax=Zychaea mexicana TaxID=64656 RepID=UPI0022FEEE15|nr:uncharacterized protein BDB00DRAFT_871366 [Zychaea mexicana]KAI9494541.1 hypothetical protein BDB00DRAFT_871366 [Zychaea mexicana]
MANATSQSKNHVDRHSGERLVTLPTEVFLQIFSLLSFNDRLVCATVCKHWHKYLNESRILWDEIELAGPKELRRFLENITMTENAALYTRRFCVSAVAHIELLMAQTWRNIESLILPCPPGMENEYLIRMINPSKTSLRTLCLDYTTATMSNEILAYILNECPNLLTLRLYDDPGLFGSAESIISNSTEAGGTLPQSQLLLLGHVSIKRRGKGINFGLVINTGKPREKNNSSNSNRQSYPSTLKLSKQNGSPTEKRFTHTTAPEEPRQYFSTLARPGGRILAQFIRGSPNIESFNIVSGLHDLDDNVLGEIGNLKSLRELHIDYCSRISPTGMCDLLRKAQGLKELSIAENSCDNDTIWCEQILEAIAELPKLKKLNIRDGHTMMTSNTLKKFIHALSLQKRSSLKELGLANIQCITYDTIIGCARLRNLTNLVIDLPTSCTIPASGLTQAVHTLFDKRKDITHPLSVTINMDTSPVLSDGKTLHFSSNDYKPSPTARRMGNGHLRFLFNVQGSQQLYFPY